MPLTHTWLLMSTSKNANKPMHYRCGMQSVEAIIASDYAYELRNLVSVGCGVL
jgi:hypothetical protein